MCPPSIAAPAADEAARPEPFQGSETERAPPQLSRGITGVTKHLSRSAGLRVWAIVACGLAGAFGARTLGRSLESRVLALGTSLGARAALPTEARQAIASPPGSDPFEVAPEEGAESEADSPNGQGSAPSRRRSRRPEEAPPSGVQVSAETVLRLAKLRAMPGAVGAPVDGKRPAGLKLAGVTRLGLGLRDGDVLTLVAGAPAASVPNVIAIVLKQRAQHAAAIDAQVWRGQVSFSLRVEMPYPDVRPALSGNLPRLIEPPPAHPGMASGPELIPRAE